MVPVDGRVLVIQAAERLDFSQHEQFCVACNETRSLKIERIDIDLENTVQIYDSGISMLIMLSRKVGKAVGSLRIINCRSDVCERLMKTNLSDSYQIAC